MVEDLTQYLYANNMLRYIEGYVQKVAPGKTPQVSLATWPLTCLWLVCSLSLALAWYASSLACDLGCR